MFCDRSGNSPLYYRVKVCQGNKEDLCKFQCFSLPLSSSHDPPPKKGTEKFTFITNSWSQYSSRVNFSCLFSTLFEAKEYQSLRTCSVLKWNTIQWFRRFTKHSLFFRGIQEAFNLSVEHLTKREERWKRKINVHSIHRLLPYHKKWKRLPQWMRAYFNEVAKIQRILSVSKSKNMRAINSTQMFFFRCTIKATNNINYTFNLFSLIRSYS